MNLRMELFVEDLDRSVNFYKNILGFTVERREPRYVEIRSGHVVFGLGLRKNLRPDHYFKQEHFEHRGTGVEIVLEVDNVQALYGEIKRRHYPLESELQKREWGLTDFRIVDPDGYYLRPTSKN